MNTETDCSRFENMTPAHVWETFNNDTPEQEYIDFIRNDRLAYGWAVESDDSELGVLAEAIADNCGVTAADRPHVIGALARYMRAELGDAAERTKLVADVIRADAREALLDFAETVTAAIDDADYATIARMGIQKTPMGKHVSELWDLLYGPA